MMEAGMAGASGEAGRVGGPAPALVRPVTRTVRASRTLGLYLLRGLLLNGVIAFIILEAVQGVLFTVRATEGFSFDFLIIFPVLLAAFGQALVYTIPLSLLFGAALLVGRLNADREVLAMRSFGLSPLQPLLPVAILGAAASLISFVLSQDWVPSLRFANRNVDTIILDNLGYLGQGSDLERTMGSTSIWIHRYEGPSLEGIFVAIYSDERSKEGEGPLPKEVLARARTLSYPLYFYSERGRVQRGVGQAEGRLVVELENVNVFFDDNLLGVKGEATFIQRMWFERLLWTPTQGQRKRKGYKDMGRQELLETIDRFRSEAIVADRGDDRAAAREMWRLHNGALTELHRRLAISLAALTFPLAAFAFGLFTNSSNRLTPFFVASALVPALYFGAEMVGKTQAERGMAPWALIESGNVVLLAVSAILLARLLRAPR
jgi:lipopolysaccharide export LptBFGC system permease protein LptF